MADYKALETAIKVEIIATKGSTPRDKGAVLWVLPDRIIGSIGGGNMENDAIAIARGMFGNTTEQSKRYILGPETGQCCGGIVDVAFSLDKLPEKTKPMLAIFGAGHVGAHLKRLAEALDIETRLFDARPFVEIERPEPYIAIAIPERAIEDLPQYAKVIIMTHDHGLDFLLAEAALKRGFPFVGMIGSKTKSARFRSQFPDLDYKNFHAPIAKDGNDKRPEIIALSILKVLI